jgi:site-specific recombinase XerD
MSEPNRRQPSLDPLIEGYLEYLADVARKARGTVRDVRCTLRRVSEAMERLVPDRPLWKLELLDYLRWIEAERQAGRGGASLNKNLSHLRGLLDYAWRSGRSDRNVLDGFQIQDDGRRKEPESLGIEEAIQLVKSCPAATPIERRDRMVILLLYGCGLRTQELCDLRLQDIDATRRELLVRAGKGDRQRIVPLPEVVYTELLAYLLERGGKRGPLLRTEKHGKALAAKHVCEVVRRAALRAGIQREVTPKALRHSYATHLMDRGVDLAVIARLMGHRSPAETGVYLHVLKDRPRGAVNRLDLAGGDAS